MSMNNLANFYRENGQYSESLCAANQDAGSAKDRTWADHPDTLLSMSNLALVYEARGQVADALSLSKETWKRRRDKFGPDHKDTLISTSNLANAYMEAGRLAEALPLFEDCAEAPPRHARPSPPQYTALDELPRPSLPRR